MVPLYAARIEDLGPVDFVKAECIACGHDELIPASAPAARATARADYPVCAISKLGCAAGDAKRAERRLAKSGDF